jgi:carbamate kinase
MTTKSDNSDKPLVVIAIGGNSLITDSEHMSVVDQYRAAGETAANIAPIVNDGYRVVVTHGNGPQVGFILLRSELAKEALHQVPLANCVADTQGSIGMQIAQSLQNAFRQQGREQQVVAIVTQVVVDPEDPSFDKPTKPIGPFMTESEARQHAEDDGWAIAEDANRGWRRVVPSPTPIEIIELPAIHTLLDSGALVVDAASCLLAQRLGAKVLVFSTDVDRVSLNFGTPEQTEIDRMNAAQCRKHLDNGHFAAGSMRPKIEAALAFIKAGGEEVIITRPPCLAEAMRGTHGTHIVP